VPQPFNSNACHDEFFCIKQPEANHVTHLLDSLSYGYMMQRLTYRNFGPRQTLLLSELRQSPKAIREQKIKLRNKPVAAKCLFEYTRSQEVQNFFGYEVIGRREKYEDTDNNSNNSIGVTAHGARPDSGARADARTGADQGHAGDSAGEREEDESPGGAEQTAGKT
jgi:hypothetical protein